MNSENDTTYINYHFSFENGRKEFFPVTIKLDDLSLVEENRSDFPAWTRLSFNQCKNCQLDEQKHTHCPIALSISGVINKFQGTKSYELVQVQVETPERNYDKKLALQQGLGSLLGIYMVTTGCPTLKVLRPMVRFHLPFATVEETLFRSTSAYLLGQYFKFKKKQESDWTLKGLVSSYEEIQQINLGITNRLRSISDEDANANAVIVLDVFAKALPSSILQDLQELEYLYHVSET
ncbi:MAG: hypothetical protein E4H13_05530 [Calditrichales bacterium]|nr:MAG: hypothetical protein E4H13_05530 [Calditrichales bacterium]